ncbi:hypothetical protein OC834_006104 [Tilletia horrida]|nr:hypothetical protein OC834_006104 [Tilletia horrida]
MTNTNTTIPNSNPDVIFEAQLTVLLDDILALCQPSAKSRDLYLWRQLFRLWHEANIFNDQPLELGGDPASAPLRKQSQSSSASGAVTAAAAAAAELESAVREAECKLEEFEVELVERRWIKRKAVPGSASTDSAAPSERSKSKDDTSPSGSAASPLAEIERGLAPPFPSGRLGRTLSLPSPFVATLRRQSTNPPVSLGRPGTLQRTTTSTSTTAPRRLSESLLPFRRRWSSAKDGTAADDEDSGEGVRMKNGKSRVAIETFLQLHRVQIERLRSAAAAAAAKATATATAPLEGWEEEDEDESGNEDVQGQLASYAFGGGSVRGPAPTLAPAPAESKDGQPQPRPQPRPNLPLTAQVNARLQRELPTLDDHRCAICLSLAFRPVLLPGCAHLFCLRCLVKLQRRFFASLRASRLERGEAGGDGEQIPRMHAGPMRSMSSVAWALYEQEAEYRASVRAQQRLRQELAAAAVQQQREQQQQQQQQQQQEASSDATQAQAQLSVSAPASSATSDPAPQQEAQANPLLTLPPKVRASADCPLCRHPHAVALADGSHVSAERERLMGAWFPREVARKKRADLKEVEREEAVRLGIDNTSCVVM